MTDNMKKFLEIVSNESDEFKEKLSKADKAEIIAIAAQKGITLTDADFEQKDDLSPDELEAVAGGCFCLGIGGGSKCGCAVGGGGTSGCVCVIMGGA